MRYIQEDFDPSINVEGGSIDINDDAVEDAINRYLSAVTAKSVVTPYIALEKIRKILAYYKIFLPQTAFLEGDEGNEVFEISQFGDKMGMTDDGEVKVKNDDGLYLYFEWMMNEDGLFDVFSEIVDEEELDEILADFDEEGEDESNDDSDGAEPSHDMYKAANMREDALSDMRARDASERQYKLNKVKVINDKMDKEGSFRGGYNAMSALKRIDKPIPQDPKFPKPNAWAGQYDKQNRGLDEMKSNNPKGIAQQITVASHAQNPSWGPANLNPDMSTDFGAKATRSSALAAIKAYRELRTKHGKVDPNNPEHIEHISKAIHGSPQDFSGNPKGWSAAAINLNAPYQDAAKKERRGKLTGAYGGLSDEEKEKDRQIARVVANRYSKKK
jgi:hypothetical protein